MTSQTASSSSSSSSFSWKYDVFLSFCGVDTRKNFTDHLYTALEQKGIITFRDDEKLERGKYISPGLLKAIEESKYAVVVLSRNYASSKWCMIELVKIVECMKDTGLIVLPVFYHVDPSHVRNQMGTLAEAFAKHEKDPKINIKDVQMWKDALKEVGNISGWHVNDSHESSDIQQILKRIFSELNYKFSSTVSKALVGIDSSVKEVLDLYLDEGSGGVCFVGICGMGGMGKTTLAQEIYKRIFVNFEASSFIDNVREKTKNQGLFSLQKQLLSKILMESETNIWKISEGINVIGNRLCNKKVLIVLDDVDGEEQLEALAGNRDWFGSGSKIIVTCRDSHLLRRCDMNFIYTVKRLNYDDALKLFSWRAFKEPHPKEDYKDLSRDFVNYAKGLPLALKVLGSLLFDKKIDEWNSALDKLKVELDEKILDVLKISYDGLTNTQKELFLDIACFFKGENKDCIREILKSFGYYPEYNIGVLIEKSLITIEVGETIWMHDLLQEMGHEIVRRESPKVPGQRSRLWLCDDVLYMLKNNTGTEIVEGIVLNTLVHKEQHLNAEAFSNMKKLRLLKIGNMQLPQGLSYLSDELHMVEWRGYPLSSMPSSFQPNKLVELRMHCSNIKQLWKGIRILDKLKIIDLSDSRNLIATPDFSGIPNLEQLILKGCNRLSKIHASLGDLKQLIRLDLNGCKCLESLSHRISSEALEIFDLGGCSRLKKFPEIVGNMPHLLELILNETAIKDLPLSMEHLTGLIKLDLRDCKNLLSLPNVTCSLMSLKTLTLSGCLKLVGLPKNLGNLKLLEELDMSRTAIKELPSSIVLLKNLVVLSLYGCEGLSYKSSNKLLPFPSVGRKGSLYPTRMLECSLSGLWSLTKLDVSYCKIQAMPDDLGSLPSLIELNLKGNNFVDLPKSIIQLYNLRYFILSGCTGLRSLQWLPLNVEYIEAESCTSLETLQSRQEDDFRPFLRLLNCVKLIGNQGYDEMLLTMLRHLFLFQEHYNREPWGYGLLIPGGEVPKVFSHQSVGASVNLQMTSDLCDKWIGIAVCAVFVLHQHSTLDQLDSKNWFSRNTHGLTVYCRVIGHEGSNNLGSSFSEEFSEIKSHHLWVYCIPSLFLNGSMVSQIDAYSHVEIRFETKGQGLEVKKCGVRLISEKDIENLKQTTAGCSNSSITPYEAVAFLHDHFDDSAMAENNTEIKQRHDDYDGAENSGEGSSNDVTYTTTIGGLGDISPGLEVKKCGKGLVYEHVSKDHKQILASYSNSSITPYEDVHHHSFNHSAVAVQETKINQSHNDYDGTGPSAEDISNNEIQHPNIIQRLMLLLGIWIEKLCTR